MSVRSMTALSAAAAAVCIGLPALLPAAASAAPCGPNVLASAPTNRTVSSSTSNSAATPSDAAAPSTSMEAAPVEYVPLGHMPGNAEGATDTADPADTAESAETGAGARATFVEWMTGPRSANQIYSRFGISGTDLGIMWDNGRTGNSRQVLIAFGDSFGTCSTSGQEWRQNVLMRSGDTDLSDGMQLPDPTVTGIYGSSPVLPSRPSFSKQVIASLGLTSRETTVIPTAGISVGDAQIVNFMSVRKWGSPGRWTTNFSAIAVSTDNGENWAVPRQTIRFNRNTGIRGATYTSGNNNFQMGAYVKRDGYVYAFGTPSGRAGSAYVSRVPEALILDQAAYEYWNGTTWVPNQPSAARAVIPARVSEMSVQWNSHLGKYIAMYTDSWNNVVLRTASQPQGPWSAKETIVTSKSIPGGIYAPYIHPWSSGNELYFTLSLWSEYNVMLMRTTLTP